MSRSCLTRRRSPRSAGSARAGSRPARRRRPWPRWGTPCPRAACGGPRDRASPGAPRRRAPHPVPLHNTLAPGLIGAARVVVEELAEPGQARRGHDDGTPLPAAPPGAHAQRAPMQARRAGRVAPPPRRQGAGCSQEARGRGARLFVPFSAIFTYSPARARDAEPCQPLHGARTFDHGPEEAGQDSVQVSPPGEPAHRVRCASSRGRRPWTPARARAGTPSAPARSDKIF
jgi:hypothetical protein